MPSSVDFDQPYVLSPDVQVVTRGPGTIQIGTELPRRALLIDAPRDADDVLRRLNPTTSIGELMRETKQDRRVWRPLLSELIDRGLLVTPQSDDARHASTRAEQISLAHRHGAATAEKILTARGDALVVVEGAGPVGESIAALVAACGVGHVFHHAGESRRRPPGWDSSPEVRVHRPAPQMPPSLVVLSNGAPPSLARAAELVTGLIPHLAVHVSQARAVVGPLVLPGRSTCLNCLDLHRTDADPCWPGVARSIGRHPVPPAPVTAHFAAALATTEILSFLDGRACPESVGATVEYVAATSRIRRRRWEPHEQCGCALLTGRLSVS